LIFFAGLGMRQSLINSGYRPHFKFKDDFRTSGQIILEKGEIFSPGEEHIVEVDFMEKYVGNRVYPGALFTVHEGLEALGEGEILKITEIIKGPVIASI